MEYSHSYKPPIPVSTLKALRSPCLKETWVLLFNTFPYRVATEPFFSLTLKVQISGALSTYLRAS